MNYKILCSDLDGTLLTTKSDVSAFTIAEVKRVKKRMRIILVSARMPKAMRYIQQDLGITHEPMVCYNGAYVVQNTTTLASTEIQMSLVERIYDLAWPLDIDMGLYYKDEWYVPADSERVQKEIRYTKSAPAFRSTQATLDNWKKRGVGAHKIMLMGTQKSADAIWPQLKQQLGDSLNLYRSNDTLIEIAPKSVSKLSAIHHLLPPEQSFLDVIAFGDNYNDVEMLQSVGCGVAVANAREEVRAVADHETLANSEDGVAHFIKRML